MDEEDIKILLALGIGVASCTMIGLILGI